MSVRGVDLFAGAGGFTCGAGNAVCPPVARDVIDAILP